MPRPPMLRLRGGRSTVLLVPNAMVSNAHLGVDRDFDTAAAQVEVHPRVPTGVVLRNRSTTPWFAQPGGEEARLVEPGQAFAVRAGTINFGSVRGEVVVPSADA
jgi:hypothetical protein